MDQALMRQHAVAWDLYRAAVLAELSRMRRDGVYVCFANIQGRLSTYNREILSDVLWAMARAGELGP